jgi:hypothetical protein
MIFARVAERFQEIPHDLWSMTIVPRRLISLATFTMASAVGAVMAAIEDAHPATVGIGFFSLVALFLNAWVMYKSGREADLRRQLDDMRRAAADDRKESMDNQASMRASLHSIRDHLNATHLENEALRRDGDVDRQANRRLSSQLREANFLIDSLKAELHEARLQLGPIATSLDHLNKGLNADRRRDEDNPPAPVES